MSAARDTADYRALLAEQDWRQLRKNLKLFAWKATGCRSMERAEDHAHDTIARVWTDETVRWDPRVEPSCFRFLTGVLRGDLSNERRLRRGKERLPGEETLHRRSDGGAGAPDVLLVAKETTARVFSALLEACADDPIGRDVAEMFQQEIDLPAEQVTASGHSIAEIRRARRRVFDRADAIRREEDEVA